MPVPAMAQSVLDHQKRFQAAVDVIHNLPKNGSYRPSYEVMLRFYGLYKQAVCGPCAGARPGFWDPVGRYKWDAWSSLGDMSSESAMAAYVDEMKKVAQEVIDTMPMNEKTASLFHHFEPLYVVIDDMPRPPESLLMLKEGLRGSEGEDGPEQVREEEQTGLPEATDEVLGLDLTEVIDLSANTVPNDPGMSEGLVLTSDSESEIFCDSVDSVEQLTDVRVEQLTDVRVEQLTDVRVEQLTDGRVGQLTYVKAPVVKSNGFHNGHVSSPVHEPEGRVEARQVGAGQGGEGANDGKGPDQGRGSRDAGRDASYHSWRERGVPQGSPRRGAPGGGGAGRGGGDGSEAAERLHDVQLQQQIILALRRLREDMRSVMERLEAVERLAATHTQGSEWRSCLHCAAAASQQQEEKWWPFDVSGQTVLLFLLWPFLAQGLVHLLRRVQRRSRVSS